MAERIKHNSNSPFGGAAVVLLPGGELIDLLVIDPSADEAQFVSMIATRLSEIAKAIDAKRKAQIVYGR